MKSLVTNLQRLSLALLAVLVVVFGSFTVLIPTASAAIYVGNLSYDVQENDIKEVFSEYGDVKNVQLPSDRETGRMQGFAFVEMGTEQDEQKAIDALDGAEWMGRNLKVNKAKPKTDGISGGRRGGGGGVYSRGRY